MSNFIWQKCITYLKKKISLINYNIYIKPLEIKFSKNILFIYAPNQFVFNLVKKKYLFVINRLIYKLFIDHSIKLKLIIGKKFSKKEIQSSNVKILSDMCFKNKKNNLDFLCKNFLYFSNLDIQYSFKNFVTGKCNNLAYFSCKFISKNLGKIYNPFFIYGCTGLGKTHLLNALGNSIFYKKKDIKILYVHSECFVQNLINSIKFNFIDNFKKYYRSIDVLLFDDIQFLAYKNHSQEEFLYILCDLLKKNKQIILSSDVFPKKILGINDRLKSLLNSGLTIMLESLDLQTRYNFLVKKIRECNVFVSKEVIYFLAKNLSHNARELKGVINRIIVNANFMKCSITVNFIKKILKDLLNFRYQIYTMDTLAKVVSNYFNISVNDLFIRTRSRIITQYRQITMALIRKMTNYSFYEIGKFFNNMDHSTVLYACKKIKRLYKTDISIQKIFFDLINLL